MKYQIIERSVLRVKMTSVLHEIINKKHPVSYRKKNSRSELGVCEWVWLGRRERCKR